MTTVACVLRSGGEYKPEHVAALYHGVRRHWPETLPLHFVALTDLTPAFAATKHFEVRPLQHRWRGWWSKLELFAAAQDDLGDILYFDLDTLIVGSLADVASTCALTLLSDFYHPERVQSGMMYLPAKNRPEAYAAWIENPAAHADRARGDGEFLDLLWRGKAATWQEVLPEQVVSYKAHVKKQGGVPANARVVCFHGRPRPWASPMWESYITS